MDEDGSCAKSMAISAQSGAATLTNLAAGCLAFH